MSKKIVLKDDSGNPAKVDLKVFITISIIIIKLVQAYMKKELTTS